MGQSYKIPSYQNIFDALITNEVSLNNIVAVLERSDYGLDTDFSVTSGTIEYEESETEEIKGGQKSTVEESETSTYTANSYQNLFDVCLMTVGDINKIIQLASSNDFNSINDYPDGAITVTYNKADITDAGFKMALKRSGINITTGVVSEPSQSGYLLQENLFAILQEDGYKIELS